MNHSLIGADRTTHLKIVSVALAAAIAVVAVGITARVADSDGSPVLTAGQPVLTAQTATLIR
jgi:hypothetical protein